MKQSQAKKHDNTMTNKILMRLILTKEISQRKALMKRISQKTAKILMRLILMKEISQRKTLMKPILMKKILKKHPRRKKIL